MQHETPLITMIVAGLVLAYIFGMIANRFKMPPLVGYLFAGMLAGPYTPGFVADQALSAELAEIGVILLMFGVGLHFSLKDLLSVRALAIPGALVQIAFATLLGLGLATLLGWGLGAGILFGLALSVASTVVLLKALQDKRLIETEKGRIAVGWLIVEDLAMVLALVLIPAFASLSGNAESAIHDPFVSFVERILGMQIGIYGVIALTLVKVAAFVGFMLIVGRRAIPWALHATAHTGSRELFRLAVLAIALGVALGSSLLFGVSLALGAFFAGMMLAESELSQRAAQETLPLRDAFAVLFFVSIGMLFDPSILVSQPLQVLATVFIIVIGKSVAAFAIVLLFRRPVATALTISASLAQIGEFSFILASMGVSLAILPKEGQDLILAGALISIVLNPVVFWAVEMAKPRLEQRVARRRGEPEVRIEPGDNTVAVEGAVVPEAPAAEAPVSDHEDEAQPTRQKDHTILVGFGRVGRVVGQGLKDAGASLVVIEDSDHSIAYARSKGIEVVSGNAASADVLKLANLAQAKVLMMAIPNGFEAGTVVEVGRKINPGIRILARAHSEDEENHLRHLGADQVIMGEREIGLGMLAWLRGERTEDIVDTAPVPPVEPKLAPVDNILEKAAATAAVVAAQPPVAAEAPVPVELVATLEPIDAAEPAAVQPAAMAEAAAVAAPENVIELPPPEAPAAPLEDVAVIKAVEAAPVGATEPVVGEEATIVEAATLESVEATPAVAETPQEIAEPALPAEETPEEEAAEDEIYEGSPVIVPEAPGIADAAPDELAAVPPAEPVSEVQAEITAEAEAEIEAEDEVSEGSPVVSPEAEPAPEPSKPEESKVPPVVPEPKI
ncbi:MAG: sodium:proton antiporter [Devosia sp.]|nr:sodium:proton antiporter [Devosia sp.]